MNDNSTSITEHLFHYEGPCTSRVIQDSVDKITGLFPEDEYNSLVKRLSSAAIEMIQNIGFYSEEKTVVDGELIGIGSFSISRNSGTCLLETRNKTTEDKLLKFEQWIKKLNSMSKDELKQLRKEFLKNGSSPGSRGANIGLLDIIRKNNSPLITSAERVNGAIYLNISVQFNEESNG